MTVPDYSEIDPATTPLNQKELAFYLRRSTEYVRAMKKAGFQMPHGTTTLHAAHRWLHQHPKFRVWRVIRVQN